MFQPSHLGQRRAETRFLLLANSNFLMLKGRVECPDMSPGHSLLRDCQTQLRNLLNHFVFISSQCDIATSVFFYCCPHQSGPPPPERGKHEVIMDEMSRGGSFQGRMIACFTRQVTWTAEEGLCRVYVELHLQYVIFNTKLYLEHRAHLSSALSASSMFQSSAEYVQMLTTSPS
jgi:hypothetical protein